MLVILDLNQILIFLYFDNIHQGTYSPGNWTGSKILNDYFAMKGVKSLHCLDINNTTELLELHYDDLDFELGPAPYYYLRLKYPIHKIKR